MIQLLSPPLQIPALSFFLETEAEGREEKVGIVRTIPNAPEKSAHLIRDRTEEGEDKPISGPDDFFNGTHGSSKGYDKKKWTEQHQIGDFEAACRLVDERAHRLSVDFTRDPTGILTLTTPLKRDGTSDADGPMSSADPGGHRLAAPRPAAEYRPAPDHEDTVGSGTSSESCNTGRRLECARAMMSARRRRHLKDDCRGIPPGPAKKILSNSLRRSRYASPTAEAPEMKRTAPKRPSHNGRRIPVCSSHDGLQVTHGPQIQQTALHSVWREEKLKPQPLPLRRSDPPIGPASRTERHTEKSPPPPKGSPFLIQGFLHQSCEGAVLPYPLPFPKS